MPRMMSALDMPFMGSWDMSPAMSRTLTGLAAPTRQWETDREMHIEMDVPDFSREDISAEIQGDYIVLSGSTTKNENTQFSESSRTASFNRSIALPSYVNKKQMNATLRGSTLHIEVPKYEFGKQPRSEQTRSITIN